MEPNVETPIMKKARVVRPPRITDLAVPIRLHVYGFLNADDVHWPELYGKDVDGDSFNCFSFWNLFKSPSKVNRFMIMTAFASTLGDLESLQYLQDMPKNPWQVQKCDNSDKRELFYILNVLMLGYGNYKSFHWARRNQFPWNELTFEVAMWKGLDLDILKWLHKKGCPLSADAFGIAVSWRDWNVLKWLREIQCPWSAYTFSCAVRERRDWEVLIWLKAHGCPWDHDSLNFAIKNNDNLLLTTYLLSEKCPSDEDTLRYALRTGNVEVLKLLGDAEYTFDGGEDDFLDAVCTEPLETLKVLHSIGCPWHDCCFGAAIERGDMEILRWLRSVGCPWNDSTFETAIETGDVEIIRWLYEEKCPPSTESAAFKALLKKYLEIVK